MTVRMTKPQATLRELLAGLKKRTGLFGEQIIRSETAADFYNVIGQNRNRIINGDMRIDQRNAGALVSSATGYITDRWNLARYTEGSGAYSAQQVGDAPAGFLNSLKITVTTAETSQPANAYWQVAHHIEGYNVADFNWGTANASSATISFWTKSSVVGTYSVCLFNIGVGFIDRTYATTYTINNANVWEYKTVTIPGDIIANAWGKTNGYGISLFFDMGSGAGQQVSANTWTYANARRVTGTTRLIANSGATWQVTGVQLEKGNIATPFDVRLYSTELALCQRYFQIVGGTGGTEHWAPGVLGSDRINIVYNFKQVMRVAPSWTATSFGSAYSYLSIYNGITTLYITGTNESYSSANSISIGFTHGGSSSAGQSGYIYFNNASARVAFSAEL